jgi:RimJ/RimL family protein N-acetyltransferase
VPHPWPLFDLRIRTPRLELRLPTDDDLVALVEIAHAGIHPPDRMPFAVAWTDLPSPEFERSFLRFHWGARATWSPDDWNLLLGVFEGGRPIGVQGMGAYRFSARRAVGTGSWLGAGSQGRGIGTEMRTAVLFLAFEGLGALVAESGALEDNEASIRVSEKLGYAPNGLGMGGPRGTPVLERRFRLAREEWQRDRVPVTLDALEPCRELFGIA